MAIDERSIETAAIAAEINEIQSLGLDALRTRGRATFGRTLRADLTKDVIGRMIAGSGSRRSAVLTAKP